MLKILFVWHIITGVIVPQEIIDGRHTYSLRTKTEIIEFAYKGEVLNYLESGTFEYNEDLED